MTWPGAISNPPAVPPERPVAPQPGTPPVPRPPVVPHRRPGGGRRVLLGLLVVALLAVPTGIAAAVSATQPTRYAAEVELLHEPEDATTAESVDREMATHSVLMQRRPLVQESAAVAGRSADALAEDLSVEIVDGSSVLRVQVVDVDPERARTALDDLVDRYLASADRLAAGSDIGRLRVLAPPTVLDEPVGPKPLQAGAAGLLVGLLLVAALLGLLRLRRGPSGAA